MNSNRNHSSKASQWSRDFLKTGNGDRIFASFVVTPRSPVVFTKSSC
ncbi:hypothetical protein [Geitlerinema sp. PCC 9228]|nr:hypothetical protein [Geitlerinema sp. PCC 9228]